MTRAQRRAAKRNAQLSTGPSTPEGKATSSRNAVKHNLSGTTFVLLPGEDPSAFEALARDYRDEWRPRTPHETFLVTQMVQARWRLDRIARMEAELTNTILFQFGEDRTDEGALLVADGVNPDPVRRLRRYAQDAERSYHRAVRELRAYRAHQQPTPAESIDHEKTRNEPTGRPVSLSTGPSDFYAASSGFGVASSDFCSPPADPCLPTSLQSEYCPPSPPALSQSIQALSTR